MAAAVLTSFNSVLNSSVTLYVCDLHETYLDKTPDVSKLNGFVTGLLVVVALLLVPVYNGADSIINLVQQLNGLLSMPILSAFIVGLLFRNVSPNAAILAVIFGTGLYAFFTFVWTPIHYIHLMLVTLICSVGFALVINRYLFRRRAAYVGPRLSNMRATSSA